MSKLKYTELKGAMRMIKRTKLSDRILPDYTQKEERLNTVTHIVGGAFAVIACALCVVFSAIKLNPMLIVTSAVYGGSLVLLYCVSSVYHGLYLCTGKKVMQVIDHCTIYFLIGGTYTPIALCGLTKVSLALGWGVFGFVWLLCAVACAFTAIDLKKYNTLSMTCYILSGWCIIAVVKPTIRAIGKEAFLWLLAGGIFYTAGAVLYGIGTKKRYMHSLFHIFVIIGSVLQFVAIFFYIVL